MKQLLKENGGLPASILWTLAIVAGVSVANIYYIQPLLNMIRHELGISEFRTNLIAMVTQIGYAAGLLFITPLGDLYQRKKIILVNFTVLIFSLLTIALTHSFHLILIASFLTGVCSMIPQIFIPIAAQFSRPEHKGRNVGIVLSGLLTGILASRVVSGFIGELIGWREMYHIAAGMMFICAIVVLKVLPDIQTNFQGKYSDLMKSLLALVKEYPQLRIYSIRAALNFGSLLAMWSCLAFKMGQAPFFANSDVIGMLGLCGVAGALTASFVGRYVKRVGVRRFNFIGCGLILFAWLLFFVGENTFVGIIAGIIIIDIGMQCIQLSNQTSIFELNPRASNRINTVFMTTYFIGGSMGTFLAGSFWQLYGWHGVIRQILLITAGAVWIIAGANILRIGIVTWLNTSQDWMFKIGEATVVFLLFFVLVFRRLYYKHTQRIEQKKERRNCPFSFFDVKSWITMIFMISLGITIRSFHLLPETFISVFYTGLSIALILTGVLFIRYWWIRRKTFAS